MTHGEQFHYLIQHGCHACELHHYFDLDLKLTTIENMKAYNNALCLSPQICISIVFRFSWDHFNSQEKLKTMLINAKFWGDKQIALWYVMVFSVVVNCRTEKLQTKVWKFPLPR